MMDRLVWLLFGAVLFLLQASVLPLVFTGKWQPDLWLICLVLSALIYDRRTIFIIAVVGGFIQDVVIGNFFGLHLFPYLALALIGSVMEQERYNKDWKLSVVATAIGSCIFLLAAGAVVLASGGRPQITAYLIHMGIPFILVNGGTALPMHYVMWKMHREKEPQW